METTNKPAELQIIPGHILTLSKTNAEAFHQQMKSVIKETGYGLFEYIEVIRFFEKLKDYVNGNSQSKIEPDRELVGMIRDEVQKYGKVFTTPRGVKFELAETGTKYDYSNCNDQELVELEGQLEVLKEKVKTRQEFLKTVPQEGLDIITGHGEPVKIFPPTKTSNSSFKVSLPK